MTYQIEFPEFDGAEFAEKLLATGNWEDTSWGVEPCPSFTCDVFRVYIDFENPELREYPEADRFSIHDESTVVLGTNNWEDVRRFIEEGYRP